jgi:hypothetical protein
MLLPGESCVNRAAHLFGANVRFVGGTCAIDTDGSVVAETVTDDEEVPCRGGARALPDG